MPSKEESTAQTTVRQELSPLPIGHGGFVTVLSSALWLLQIRHAAARRVTMTTADSVGEMEKLARWHPAARVLLRIRADDASALCCLGTKYGADPADAAAILSAAAALGVDIIGVSFHVGSASRDPQVIYRNPPLSDLRKIQYSIKFDKVRWMAFSKGSLHSPKGAEQKALPCRRKCCSACLGARFSDLSPMVSA